MDQDRQIIKRFKSKDRESFDEIFEKYYKPIYYFIYKMAYNSEAAEDITQDTFVKVYKNLDKVEDDIKLSPWIYKIAHNTFIDYTRKHKISYELIDNISYESELLNNNVSDNPEANYMNVDLKNKINRTMVKLNNRYKSVLILRDYNNLSYKEVALILNLTETAVKSLIHRARLEFQKIFKEL
ncbi:MAG: polymerase subunit sigma-24 [Clostridia bacterium]|nr:polymerase subunit sigma-24 [Clostridia bacterium]